MESLRQLVGPSFLIVGSAVLHSLGVAGAISLTMIVLGIYILGVVPENDYFPQVWFRNNIFMKLYGLYCSERVGYKFLRHLLHPRISLPHSDYRHGVRLLSGECEAPSSPFHQGFETSLDFYKRGGGLVSLAAIGKFATAGRRVGVAVVPVPILRDNYAYLILSFETRRCAVVDPADPVLVLNMLTTMQYVTGVNFVMTDILTTHKHWDHAGGNMELLMQARSQSGVPGTLLDADMSIYGSVLDRPHACTNFVDDGDVLTVAGGGVKVTVLHSPGHTKGSVMFLVGDAFHSQHETQRLALFTGDCLFCGGCGAPFELTNVDEALQVYDLFNDCNTWKHPVTGQTVPQDAVLVYVGHEYTAMLLKQLNHIGALRKSCKEKCNSENENFHHSVQRAYTETRQLRNTYTSDNTYRNVGDSVSPNDPLVLPACTVPSTVSIERKINPLLTLRRCDLIALKLKRCPQTSLMEAMYVSRSEEVTE